MSLILEEVKLHISENPLVQEIYDFEQGDFCIKGKVKIAFDGLEHPLEFEVEILHQYPLKGYETESITFRNKNLKAYNHVMGDGSICIHTQHTINLKQKLIIDFEALKNWIIKYYINKDLDSNYEHIIVPESAMNGVYHSYIFTDTNRSFVKGEFGDVDISSLNAGIYKGESILSFIVQSFKPLEDEPAKCEWSNIYKSFQVTHKGFFIFIGEVPAVHNRFVFKKWSDFDNIFPEEFLKALYKFEEKHFKKSKGAVVPLFIGYYTVGSEIHWQTALLEVGEFPLYGMPEKKDNVKTGHWISKLTNREISWALSRNSSYKYFFGRGTLSSNIIEKKILIIGVGAVGSIISKTLTRGGCKSIDFIDYDVKEPENVCRSEYLFNSGLTDKTDELKNYLSAISPFIEIKPLNNNYFETLIKTFHKDKAYKNKFTNEINNYDLIFDCSTDNDLMYVLNSMNLSAELINVSITNHAKELVCAFHPNVYRFVNNQFGNVLENDVDDLYNPIGCWNPTFKASYNDIDCLVQLAIKHINILFHEAMPKTNFVVKADEAKSTNLTVIEF